MPRPASEDIEDAESEDVDVFAVVAERDEVATGSRHVRRAGMGACGSGGWASSAQVQMYFVYFVLSVKNGPSLAKGFRRRLPTSCQHFGWESVEK